MLRLLPLVLAGVVLLGATAPAAPAAPPRSAQAFADAFIRAGTAVQAKRAELRGFYEALPIESCRELAALERDIPARAQERLTLLFLFTSFQPLQQAFTPVQQQLLADLDAISTGDPLLRTERAQIRKAVAVTRTRPVLDRPCEQIQRWVEADFAPSAAPPASMAALRAGLVSPTVAQRGVRATDRAFRRLRALGVPAPVVRRARRWADISAILPRDLTDGVFSYTTPDGKPI